MPYDANELTHAQLDRLCADHSPRCPVHPGFIDPPKKRVCAKLPICLEAKKQAAVAAIKIRRRV